MSCFQGSCHISWSRWCPWPLGILLLAMTKAQADVTSHTEYINTLPVDNICVTNAGIGSSIPVAVWCFAHCSSHANMCTKCKFLQSSTGRCVVLCILQESCQYVYKRQALTIQHRSLCGAHCTLQESCQYVYKKQVGGCVSLHPLGGAGHKTTSFPIPRRWYLHYLRSFSCSLYKRQALTTQYRVAMWCFVHCILQETCHYALCVDYVLKTPPMCWLCVKNAMCWLCV
jgi:hypothetical protein